MPEDPRADLLQGTLDLLILKTLALGPMHGWGIAVRLRELSSDALQVQQGSLYPAVHRLERQGLVKSSWGQSDNNRRARFYELTRAGQRRLATEEETWERFAAAVAQVLGAAP
jgi:transcriptional regulator